MGRRFPFVLIFILTALCICCAYYLHVPWDLRADTEADFLDSPAVFRVHITEPPARKQSSWLLPVYLVSMQQRGHAPRALNQDALLYIRTDSACAFTPKTGDVWLAHTRITRPKALFDGEFDYGNYLRLQHKVGIGYVNASQLQYVSHVPVRSVRVRALQIQQALSQRFADAGLTGTPLALVSAITLGDKDELGSSLRQSFAAAGAAHVLAVSGLHTGIIYLIVVWLLTCFNRFPPLYEQRVRRIALASCVIAVMWGYAFVTGLSPSVMRAVVMLTIVQFGTMIRRSSISLNSLAAAACICLWVNPLSLFSISFQLSFSAVLGILLFGRYMNAVWKVRNRALRYLRDCVTISIAAMIGTLPVTLYHFGQTAHYFVLANLVVLPAAFVLVVLGLATLLLAHTTLGVWLAMVLQHLSSLVCSYIEWIEHLPHATLQLSLTPWMLVCLILSIACCYMSIHRKRLAWLLPGVAAIGLFCLLHIQDVHASATQQTIAIRGKTLYCKHAGKTDNYPLTQRYTFFRYNQTDWVYAPNLTENKHAQLQEFCRQHNICLWGQ